MAAFQKPTPPGSSIGLGREVDDGNRDPGRRLPLHVDESTADDLLGAKANLDLRCKGVRIRAAAIPCQSRRLPAITSRFTELCRRGARQQHPEAAHCDRRLPAR